MFERNCVDTANRPGYHPAATFIPRKGNGVPQAYSYIRFSSPQQSTGDSVRRQVERRQRWLADHPGVQFDETLAMTDAGRTAFNRKDWDNYALARFVDCIKSGRVELGSYLLVENLDRLSRENAGVATELFLSIVNKGVVIVQLLPEVVEYRRPVDMMKLMQAVMELSRGHSESAAKSERGLEVREKMRRDARAGKVRVKKLPAWVRMNEAGKLVLDPEKAATVRRVFHLTRSGIGVITLCRRLNAEKVPTLARAKAWTDTAIYYLLGCRTVLGEYQPHRGRKKDRQPVGDPIQGYYPRVVDDEMWHAVQGLLATRAKVGRGRRGTRVNVFAGLLVNARDGGRVGYKHFRRKHEPMLFPYAARVSGAGGDWASFPSDHFDCAVLSQLREVTAADLATDNDAARKVEALAGQLAETDQLVTLWTAKMDDPNLVDVVAAKLATLNAQRKTIAAKLATAQNEAASPLSESWGEFRSLADLLARDDSDELRGKVRDALRRSVEAVYCLFRPGRSYTRVAAVRVQFRGTAEHRDYLLVCASEKPHVKARTTAVVSFKEAGLPAGNLDLRKVEHAAKLDELLRRLDLANLATPTTAKSRSRKPCRLSK